MSCGRRCSASGWDGRSSGYRNVGVGGGGGGEGEMILGGGGVGGGMEVGVGFLWLCGLWAAS